MYRLLALTTLVTLLLAACGSAGRTDEGHGAHGSGATATATTSTATAGDFDRAFIQSMSAHHESAVQMAEVALERAEHPQLKTLAQQIIEGQKAEQEKMAAWHKEWYGAPLAEGNHSGHRSDMPGMQMEGAMGVSPEDLADADPFDRAFIDAMIPHHEAAIMDARQALQKAGRQEIKDLARNIVETQQREIDQMRSWRAQWYGS